VATALGHAGFATLQLRLPPDRAAVRALAAAVGWLRTVDAARALPLGIFGAGHAAAPALSATAADGDVRAVVAAGAGPELSGVDLADVRAAALLVVGGEDRVALGVNRSARGRLGGEGRVAVVAGGGPALREPGSREQVAHLTTEWFARHV
jgi:putative phosphoribosyl transferase